MPMGYYCYDCADEGMPVESSFLDEHPGHDIRRESFRYRPERCPTCGYAMTKQGERYICVQCGATMGPYVPRESMRRPEDQAAKDARELHEAEKEAMESIHDLERTLKKVSGHKRRK